MVELKVGDWACSYSDAQDPDEDSRAHLIERIDTEPQPEVEGLWMDMECSRILGVSGANLPLCPADYLAVVPPEDMPKCEECLVIQDLKSWLINLDECIAAGDSNAILSSVSWQDQADRLREAIRILRHEHL